MKWMKRWYDAIYPFSMEIKQTWDIIIYCCCCCCCISFYIFIFVSVCDEKINPTPCIHKLTNARTTKSGLKASQWCYQQKAFVHFRSIVYLHFFYWCLKCSRRYHISAFEPSPHRKINMYRIELEKCRLSEMKLFHAPMNTITETIPHTHSQTHRIETTDWRRGSTID